MLSLHSGCLPRDAALAKSIRNEVLMGPARRRVSEYLPAVIGPGTPSSLDHPGSFADQSSGA